MTERSVKCWPTAAPPLSQLSPRDLEVARLVADGLTDKQIVGELGLSQQRVSQIVQRIAALWRLDRRRNIRVQIATRVRSAA